MNRRLKIPREITLIVLLGLAIYANGLQGPFLNDDYKHIVENPAAQNLADFGGLWRSFNTRLIPGLTFAVNFALGGLNPFGYHLFNVLVHIAAALLLFQMLKKLLCASCFDQLSSNGRDLALTGALIFLVHPIQTQSVTYISQRFVTLSAVFYFSAILCYLNWRKNNKSKDYILALSFMGLGCFTKENTATIVLALLLCEWILLKPRPGIKSRVWPFALAPIIIGVILLFNADDSATRIRQAVSLSSFDGRYLLTELNVLRTYWRLLFIPVNQVFSYDYPIARGLLDGSVWVSIIVHAVLLWTAMRIRHKWPLITFGIFWFYIHTLVEVVSVVFGNRGVIYENWLYLPSVGFAMIVAQALYLIIKRPRIRLLVLIIMVAGFSLLAVQRNAVYQSRVTFWKDITIKQPSPYHNIEYALSLSDAGEIEDAEKVYKELIIRMPKFLPGYVNLGNLYVQTKRFDMAEDVYSKGLHIHYNYYDLHYNIGQMYLETGRYQKAVFHLDYAHTIYPPGTEAPAALQRARQKMGFRGGGLN